MKTLFLFCILFCFQARSLAMADISVGAKAPLFQTQTHLGQDFSLASQKGRWTVLYFYPKAETPGCTKQACAFRDSIDKITALKADVYGISTDDVSAQKSFHEKHHLNFTLLADPDGKVTELYGSKMPVLKMSKRWTFIIDPNLTIRSLNKDVDPAKDSEQVAVKIKELQKNTP
jgi:peroxiredoxin Q/BCP